ncbi:MAG: Ni/Fe hydrogenase subunit alpha [Candidatus Hydrogenedentota bacterium]|jgi:coenzyme F420-reducing hydrogenase alpha subunit|uniref:Group 3b Ni,Fe-hydrogenase, large subunit n=1 Tax=Sumerlaea chitinivorans TaxID=2250252 RepID=A0A2Z4Y8P5_SUMC1|nr:Group 3b Ni,Fe-hydrogenase, large subunit [Candidatus Sumerlaea chitinivorans]RMH25044.1 MAG: Ni/Fe hydrogenase subunit alpha [Candidatus Hydrogenedentota bacterium]GIX44713.1 MAG: Ni/Fe hydrogenase subunit alpha [Candidatus Sumerlaea sp.]
MKSNRVIKVDALARVEGEGAIYVKIRNGQVADVKLKIYEPPRFFEAFLRGRRYTEAPDITARICGICPVAYQMSSVHAMENACGVKVGGQLRALRRLLYCGEWIESHALHVFMLHAPDFLGYEDAIQMAKDHPDVVKMALELKKIGNEIVQVLGGREVHPINVRVGGFYRVPTKREFAPLIEKLKWALEASLKSVAFTAKLPFPDFEQDYEFVALRHPDEYPLCEGRLVSNKGLDISIAEFTEHIVEEHVAHSNALHARIVKRGAFFVGPNARYSLNFDKLPPVAQEAAKEAGLEPVCRNPFKSIVIRCVEMVFACYEALRILEQYEPPDRPYVDTHPRAGIGHGCSEAPRGILYHRYRINDEGLIVDARIVPPTAQNQRTIELDLQNFVPRHMNLSDEKLTWVCEQAVRNYDPCISCATHFLKLHIERE